MLNKVIIMGRLMKNPVVSRKATNDGELITAKYALISERDVQKEGRQNADMIWVNAFGKRAEFAEKYLKKGMKIVVEGKITSGSYYDQEGRKIYTTEILAQNHYFADHKKDEAPEQEKVHGKDDFDGIYEEYMKDSAYEESYNLN